MTAEQGFTGGVTPPEAVVGTFIQPVGQPEHLFQSVKSFIDNIRTRFSIPYNTANGKAPEFNAQEGENISPTAKNNVIYLANTITEQATKNP